MVEATIAVDGAGKLVAADGADGDRFGRAVAIDGDTLVVGASLRADGTPGLFDSAYVFVRDPASGWSRQATLTLTDGPNSGRFGYSVAIQGDTILVGASEGDATGFGGGLVAVYVREGNVWSQQAVLVADDAAQDAYFGSSVDLDGDTALIGARDDGQSTPRGMRGSAYVFTRDGDTWSQQAKLAPDDIATSAWFGTSVALEGDTALIGASSDRTVTDFTGSAYVYARDSQGWSLQHKLVASDPGEGRQFGASVSLDQGRALVGAPGVRGSAYVFERDDDGWVERAVLDAGPADEFEAFGSSVSLQGDLALIGAPSDSATGLTGFARLFSWSDDAGWSQDLELSGELVRFDSLGFAVALDDFTALVGAPVDAGAGASSGAAYPFDLLKADAGGPYRVDVDGTTALDATGSFGRIIEAAWDLDGDGRFEVDGFTPTFDASGRPSGATTVALRISGTAGTIEDTASLTVGSASQPGAGGSGSGGAGGGAAPTVDDGGSEVPSVLDCSARTAASFGDVEADSTHADAIGCLGASGIFTGFDDGTFGPHRSITRAQAASVLFRAMDVAGATLDIEALKFSDVDGVHGEAIGALAAAEVVTGFADGTFRPGEPVSRAQFSSMIDRAATALEQPFPTGTQTFGDVSAQSVHAGSIAALDETDIVTGYPDGTFRPTDPVSRAQAATMLTNWLTMVRPVG